MWLAGRPIPRSALLEGEQEGVSYGDRFVEYLGLAVESMRTGIPPAPTVAGSDSGLDMLLDRTLGQALDRLRGTADLDAAGELVLGLLYLRARDSEQWSELLKTMATPESRALSERLASAFRTTRANPGARAILRRIRPVGWSDRRLAKLIEDLDRLGDYVPTNTGTTARSEAVACRWFLERLALTDGKRGGEFFTPHELVRLMARLLAPEPEERIGDPCCGSGGFLVGAAEYVEEQGGSTSELSLHGQALSERSLTLASLNLAVHGLRADVGSHAANALRDDIHRDQHYDVILSNPPFNLSGWTDEDPADDPRWRYGPPPRSRADFAWLQHIESKLSERGRAAVVMANGAAISSNAQERAIRTAVIEAGVVVCVIQLPDKLFRSTMIPVTLWLLRRSAEGEHDSVLFIDAGRLGKMVDRTHRVLGQEDVDRIFSTRKEWVDQGRSAQVQQELDFARSVTIDAIRSCDYDLLPRRYTTPALELKYPSRERIREIRDDLAILHDRAAEIDAAVTGRLDGLTS